MQLIRSSLASPQSSSKTMDSDRELSPMSIRRSAVTILSLAAALVSGCTGGQKPRAYTVLTGGHADHGKELLSEFRCGSCHTIPGVDDANGVFGPPLMKMAARGYIAGIFPNTPDTLARWVMEPQTMKPKTAMPDLGISHQQARDITAYLETLR
jgi:cytochrome c